MSCRSLRFVGEGTAAVDSQWTIIPVEATNDAEPAEPNVGVVNGGSLNRQNIIPLTSPLVSTRAPKGRLECTDTSTSNKRVLPVRLQLLTSRAIFAAILAVAHVDMYIVLLECYAGTATSMVL